MAPPPPRPKHLNLPTYHLMSCILLLASTTTSAAAAASTYSSACPSVPAAADRHTDADDALALTRSFQIYDAHFSGVATEDSVFSFDEDQLHNRYHSFSLFPDRATRTSDPALVHLAATLELDGPRRVRNGTNINPPVSFALDGYYSAASLELCMVGASSSRATTTNEVVVLRLRVPRPPRLADPFVTGTLEGSSGLGTIRLLAYAQGDDYEYGDSAGRAATCIPPAAPPLQALDAVPACAHLIDQLVTSYRLVPQDDHHGGGGAPARLPRRMHVNQMRCTADGAVRAYVVFSDDDVEWRAYDGFMVGEEAAVAEGHWDTEQSMLCLRACRVVTLKPSATLALAVGECGIGMSFWFPAVWTVRDRSVAAGMLWNTSVQTGPIISSAVNAISSFSIDDPTVHHRRNLSGVRYEYNDTMLEEAKKHYLTIHKDTKKIRGSFPVPASNYVTYHDFSLLFFSTGTAGDGVAYPVSIGSVMTSEDALAAADEESFSRHSVAGAKHGLLLTVSYDIHHYTPQPRRISAEGVYDPRRGILCMVGCREHNGSTDCRILVTAQLASLDSKHGHGHGVISSLRDRADPLFFEKTDIYLHGMYSQQLSDAVSRMDLESVLLVASATLSCVFAAAQILHAKRHPEAAPATSLTMLAVLALGCLAPLVLGFEVVFASRRSRFGLPADNNGWLELNGVMVSVPALVAFVLHLRLLQLAFSGRRRRRSVADQSKPSSVASSERSVLKVCLPLYLLGAILAIVVHAVNARAARELDSLVVRLGGPPATLWEDLVSYCGLIVDGFLLPQVILNTAASSSGRSGVVQAISPWFYMGGTVIRVMPHVYDLVRRQVYVPSISPSDVFASPRGDLFGVAWDVAVPCGAALLASLLFWQQRRP